MHRQMAAQNYFEETKKKKEGEQVSFCESPLEPLSLSFYTGHIDEDINTHGPFLF